METLGNHAGAEPAILARGVWKSLTGPPVLRDVSLTVRSGETLALLGPNGAGKSTLLHVLAGVMRPSRGVVVILGRSVEDPAVRRYIGFAGHRSALYGHLTAIENLRFFADLYAMPYRHAELSLELFGLGEYRDTPVRLLSRGIVQRVSLARAILHDPRVLLLDEPFTGLDASSAARLRELLSSLRLRGCAIVVATHQWNEARELADHAVVLVGSRVAANEPAAGLTPDRLAALYEERRPGVRGPRPGAPVYAESTE